MFLVLSLGLPRFFVVCSGPHCDRQLEFVHASGTCCDHQHPSDAADDDCGGTGTEGHTGCVDLALATGTGPLPERVSLDHHDDPPCLGPVPALAPASPRVMHALVRPPATPPRTDQRTALLASTLLLL